MSIWLLYGIIVVLMACLVSSNYWLYRANDLMNRQTKALAESTVLLDWATKRIKELEHERTH